MNEEGKSITTLDGHGRKMKQSNTKKSFQQIVDFLIANIVKHNYKINL